MSQSKGGAKEGPLCERGGGSVRQRPRVGRGGAPPREAGQPLRPPPPAASYPARAAAFQFSRALSSAAADVTRALNDLSAPAPRACAREVGAGRGANPGHMRAGRLVWGGVAAFQKPLASCRPTATARRALESASDPRLCFRAGVTAIIPQLPEPAGPLAEPEPVPRFWRDRGGQGVQHVGLGAESKAAALTGLGAESSRCSKEHRARSKKQQWIGLGVGSRVAAWAGSRTLQWIKQGILGWEQKAEQAVSPGLGAESGAAESRCSSGSGRELQRSQTRRDFQRPSHPSPSLQ